MRIQRRFARICATVCLATALIVALAAGPALADTTLAVHPHSGPPGTAIRVHGTGFHVGFCSAVSVSFTDSTGTIFSLAKVPVKADGSFGLRTAIPVDAALGRGNVTAHQGSYFGPTHRCIPLGLTRSDQFRVT